METKATFFRSLLLLRSSVKNPAKPIKASELGSGTDSAERVKLPRRSAPAPDVPAPIKSDVKVPLICTEPYAERAPDVGGVTEGSVMSKVAGFMSKTVAPEIASPSPAEPLPLSRVRLVNPGVKVKLNMAESKLATWKTGLVTALEKITLIMFVVVPPEVHPMRSPNGFVGSKTLG